MGKFACTCGHVISDCQCPNDVTGDVLSDKSFNVLSDAIVSVVQDYLEHLQKGQVDEWRTQHLGNDYPDDLSAGDMIEDVLTSKFWDLTLAMFECDQCGRLWVQRAVGVNEYRGYSPDDPESRVKILGLNQRSE